MKTINGSLLKNFLISGSSNIINNKDRIDAMNVFPVPDGDTGSNMAGTVQAGIDELKRIDGNVDKISSTYGRATLMSARGNSGVIMSQIIKGLTVVAKNKELFTIKDLIEMFVQSQIYSYKSVMTPIEGTILTVVRITSEKLQEKKDTYNSIEEVLKDAVTFAKQACKRTPEWLPVLREVGVTDSGGEGYLMFIEGLYLSSIGKDVTISDQQAEVDAFLDMGGDWEEGEYGYCTEFILILKKPKLFDKEKFSKTMDRFGNSMVLVQDENIVKLHLHTQNPGSLIKYAMKFGDFVKIKSENMTIQANNASEDAKTIRIKENQENPTDGLISSSSNKETAIISVNSGSGFEKEMVDFGVDYVIGGGQTDNPSTRDFFKAIEEVNNKNIILLPNNGNIILAAQQVAQTVQNKNIVVLPTKTQIQGIVAMMNYSSESSIEDNYEFMQETLSEVATIQVTKASKTTKINGVQVVKGQYLSIGNKKIYKSTPNKIDAAIYAIKQLVNKETEVVSIFYGMNSSSAEADSIVEKVEIELNEIDFEIKRGDQPTYDFIIGVE
ncbi:MAG: DAK2 domain-containing protein [Mollicutes bacterium PWAP]|nr:DAK2 domain-containing protein [Mollicutes bacterium PWAP]